MGSCHFPIKSVVDQDEVAESGASSPSLQIDGNRVESVDSFVYSSLQKSKDSRRDMKCRISINRVFLKSDMARHAASFS